MVHQRQPGYHARPQGHITRGKTAQNRLRRVDNYLLMEEGSLIRRQDGDYAEALYVDLGYGAEPSTTLESAERLRTLNPGLSVLGVEIDPERVAAALPFANALTDFREGGFNLPLRAGEAVRLLRAFNVLRQYEEAAVAEAYLSMADGLLPGGLIIEGTSDPTGRVWVANLVRKKPDGGLWWEALLFSTNFRWGFQPDLFQPVLPKNLIHRMVAGEPIESFFGAWKRAYRESLAFKDWGLRQLFAASAERLAMYGYAINLNRKLLARGYLRWEINKMFV